MKLSDLNPYIRDAEIQNAILEGERERYAYDHRLFYVLENSGEIVIEGKKIKITSDTAIIIPPAVGYRFCGKLKVALLNFDMTRLAESKKKAVCPPVKELFAPSLVFDSTVLDGFDAVLDLHLSVQSGNLCRESLLVIVFLPLFFCERGIPCFMSGYGCLCGVFEIKGIKLEKLKGVMSLHE